MASGQPPKAVQRHMAHPVCTKNHFLFKMYYPKKKLKVSNSQNKFMKSSFLSKYERNILMISALASKERSNQKNKGTYTNYGYI